MTGDEQELDQGHWANGDAEEHLIRKLCFGDQGHVFNLVPAQRCRAMTAPVD